MLRGDSVKDDSGPYAVFTEHGSSASQMTAAKVMDVISRLPRCAGQAADAVSAYTQVRMEDAPSSSKDPKIRMSRYLDTSTKTNGLNHGPAWKIQPFFLSEICTVTLWQDYYGKGNARKFCWNTVEQKFHIGNVLSLTEKKDYSCLCTWTISKWQERNKIWIQCGNTHVRC